MTQPRDKFRLKGKLHDIQETPYLSLTVVVGTAVNPGDLTTKTYSGVDWLAKNAKQGKVVFEDEVTLGRQGTYTRVMASASASILPTPGGVTDLDTMELIAPNWDSCGGYGATCLLPPNSQK